MKAMLTRIALAIFFLSSLATAGIERKPKLDFSIEPDKLLKGDIVFSHKIMSAKIFRRKYLHLRSVDTLGLSQNDASRLLVAKSAFVVKKPVEFFDARNLATEKFISVMNDGTKVRKQTETTFEVGSKKEGFIKKVTFESDDISSLDTKKTAQAVARIKKLDVITQSSFSSMVEEDTSNQRKEDGAITISSFIPLKENRTLVLRFEILTLPPGVKKEVIRKTLETNLQSYQKRLKEF
jgi:hypothetical protein